MPSPETFWQISREWMTAVGTIAAAGIAVYLGVIQDRVRRPRLRLAFDAAPSSQDCVVVDVDPGEPKHVAYYRLKVQTSKRRAAAEDAEVMVIGARSLTAVEPIRIEGQLLVWSNTNDITRLTIPPGVPRYVDLLQIRASWVHNSVPAPVHFDVRPLPTDRRNCVPAGRYELELAVMARNAAAQRFRVEVSYDGGWGEGAEGIRDHLAVSAPTLLK